MCTSKFNAYTDSNLFEHNVKNHHMASIYELLLNGENGQETSLTIFARISFYSVGNGNGKVRKNMVGKIWSIKNG
jgi:hypothetical protein